MLYNRCLVELPVARLKKTSRNRGASLGEGHYLFEKMFDRLYDTNITNPNPDFYG